MRRKKLRMSEGRARQYWNQHAPGRPPEFAWNMALEHVRRGRRLFRKFDGDWACTAAELIRERNLSGDEEEIPLSRRHRRPWQAIREAHHIWKKNRPPRWEIEARILAKQNDEEIAAAAQIPADAVAAFEALFFRVRDHLEHRGFINTYILRLHEPFDGRNVAKIWKFFAFNANTVVLQYMIDEFRQRDRPDYTDLETGGIVDFGPDCPHAAFWRALQVLFLPEDLPYLELLELRYRRLLAREMRGRPEPEVSPLSAEVREQRRREIADLGRREGTGVA
jgi:hypothetical protein